MAEIYVGTSGFNYKHWKDGVFYPTGLAQSKWLEFYTRKFNSVELNVSFYRLPKLSTFEKWKSGVPVDFKFAVKGSRYITHIKRLNDVEESLKMFSERIAGLGNKASVVLWQFGANFKIDVLRLKVFCNLLNRDKVLRGIRHAFEFRSASWFTDSVYRELRKNNFSLVVADSKRWPKAEVLTADFVYLRFHGGVLFTSNYPRKELESWADKVKSWIGERDLYAYFNNDALGYAPKNAITFKALLRSKL